MTPIDEDRLKLELSLTTSPEPGDTQIGQEGAKVYPDENAVPLLDDKILSTAGSKRQRGT